MLYVLHWPDLPGLVMVISADHIVKFIDDSPSFTPPQMAFFLFSSIDHQSTEAQAHVNLGCHT